MGIDHFEWNQMMAEELYHPLKVGDSSWERMQEAQWKFNHSRFWEDEEALTDLRKCLAQAPGDLILTPPVYFDHGDRIVFGKNCYANTDLTILDEHWVRIGDHVLMGPHVSIYTANHPLDPVVRREGLETAHPVTIEDDVWIGGRVVINPGVRIGAGSIIGSGSVVTKDIPSGVVAAGNPCKVIRELNAEDRNRWQKKLEEYDRKRRQT